MSDLPSRERFSDADIKTLYKHGFFDEEKIVMAWMSGRLVDREDIDKMWVCLFDGPNDLCEQGVMSSKHQKVCGEFWLLPVASAIETPNERARQ